MPLTNPDVPITKKDLSDFYQAILPYLGGSAENLNDLLNVVISNVADGEILQYDSTSGKWINVSNAGGVQIDDTTTSTTKTWSSNKINTELGNKQGTLTTSDGIDITSGTISAKIDGDTITFNAQGQMVASVSVADLIDDTTTSSSKSWSSQKINSELGNKQDSLTTGDGIDISNGVITAKIDNSTITVNAQGQMVANTSTVGSLDDLEDVSISSPTNNQILRYNSTTEEWENSNESTGVEIDDTTTSISSVWSSNKVSSEIASKTEIDDSATAATNTWSASKINSVITALAIIDFSIVQTLPIEDISTHTIYLVPKTTAGTDDVFDEYIYINEDWEHIGDTTIDLSNYYTKTETDSLLDDKQDELIAGEGIEIDSYNVIKSTGAIIYANALFPSGE